MSSSKPKAFHYKQAPRPPLQAVNRADPLKQAEMLGGVVQGKAASDIEERFARALERNPRVDDYQFIVHTITGANLPGEAQLDFLVTSGGQDYAVQIDGAFAHKTAAQKEQDRVQDVRLSEVLNGKVAAPLPLPDIQPNGLIARVPGWLLETQAAADSLAQEMF